MGEHNVLGRRWGAVWNWIFLGLAMAISLLPFLWMISTSLGDGASIYQFPPQWIPRDPQWGNYAHVWKSVPILRYFANSIFVTLMVTAGTLVTTILAAFAMTRLDFRGKKYIFMVLAATMMVPGEVLIAPNFVFLSRMHLVNTITALYIPWIASAFSIFMLRQYFLGIPEALYAAAKVDGCGDWTFLWRIMVPYARPALISIALLRVINSWNEFLWPLLMVSSAEKRTLPVGLTTFMTEAGAHYQYLMAYATIVILPVIVLYLFLQKHIMDGFARGGIKG